MPLKRLIRVKAFLGLAIEGHQVPQVHMLLTGQGSGRHVFEVGNQHAELGSPIPQVVESQHVVPTERQQPGNAVPNDGGAQVPHMHLLGDVGAGKIHHHPLLRLRHGHPQPGLIQPLLHLCRQHLRTDGEVDKPWSRHLGWMAEVPHL